MIIGMTEVLSDDDGYFFVLKEFEQFCAVV